MNFYHHKVKQLSSAILLVICTLTFGQENKQSSIDEDILLVIQENVWKPFMEAYRDYDEEKLKSIHTSDIIRVNIDRNKIRTGQTYLEEFSAFLPRMEEHGDKVGIVFAILSTALDESGAIAYQTGYYQFQMQSKDEEALTPRGYGYFQVGLRKEKGIWKIFLDSDRKVELNEAEFLKNGILYELEN